MEDTTFKTVNVPSRVGPGPLPSTGATNDPDVQGLLVRFPSPESLVGHTTYPVPPPQQGVTGRGGTARVVLLGPVPVDGSRRRQGSR